MTFPSTRFEQELCILTIEALAEIDPSQHWEVDSLAVLIEQPPNPEMGDFALPCFGFSKTLRRAPKQIAAELAEILLQRNPESSPFIRIQSNGPYLNFTVSARSLALELLPRIFQGTFFSAPENMTPERVMIEYSQPNTHKGFHVGHLRNVALGDSLCRIYRYNGYEVIGANYLGDVGAHIAKCLWYYLNRNDDSPPRTLKGKWLGELYTRAVQTLEQLQGSAVQEAEQEVSKLLQLLEQGDPEMHAVWEQTRQWSMEDFYEIYQWLDVKFDHYFYESEVDDEGRQIVLDGERAGTFVRSDGALGIDLEDEGLGFFMLLKSDGNTLYSTKDLALAKRKFEQFAINRSVYVVGAEQTLHFKQVFATLKRMGYAQADKCYHLPYALVMLPSGKMSSRAGNVILFSQMRREMMEYIRNRHLSDHRDDWRREEIEETAHRVAVAAIKYGMLNQDPNKPIVFSMEDWLVSEGNTGTYLVYAYVRIRSIGRRVSRDVCDSVDFSLLSHPNEKLLLRRIMDFNRVAWKAGEQFRPSLVARFLYELSKVFSKTYSTCSVKHAGSDELQAARLLLFHCVAEVLHEGLGLLGITPPERM